MHKTRKPGSAANAKARAGPKTRQGRNWSTVSGYQPAAFSKSFEKSASTRFPTMGELRLVEKRVVIALRSIQARREEHELDLAKKNVVSRESTVAAG
jgi:hypothetical protein